MDLASDWLKVFQYLKYHGLRFLFITANEGFSFIV